MKNGLQATSHLKFREYLMQSQASRTFLFAFCLIGFVTTVSADETLPIRHSHFVMSGEALAADVGLDV